MRTIFLNLAALFLALVLLVPVNADAQSRDQNVWRDSAPMQPMNSPAPPGLPDKPTQTPIGSGLGILLVAGGAYAVRKIRKDSNQLSEK